MKIGILTYHRSHNYGALLQAYALKTYLEQNQHDVEFVDYYPDYHAENYKLLPHFRYYSLINKCKVLVKLVFALRITLIRRKGYENFILDSLKLSKNAKFKRLEDLTTLTYDAVVYGSDQIWRIQDFPGYKGFSTAYFGEGISARLKLSYAASMGKISINEIDESELQRLLRNFNAISVRENDLQKIILNYTKLKVRRVLDPVFLLSRENWTKLITNHARRKKEYILFYNIMKSKNARLLANEIARSSSYEVYEIRGRVYPFKFTERFRYQTASPNEFLSLLCDAQIVISTSFHGVAFSLLFEKEFYALGMGDNSSRVKSLLSELNIQERYIENIEEAKVTEKLDYELINNKIMKLRNESYDFLNSNLVT
jgi:polysaccharide pyruvyl transferase WcaK-like protein